MQQHILTDQELKRADLSTRRWWARVYTLVNSTGCTLEQAIATVRLADKESNTRT